MDHALQLEETRVLSNDWVVRYDTRYLQVTRQSRLAPARSTVVVREAVSGAIEIRYRGRLMQWREIAAPPARATVATRPAVTGPSHRRPSADHPWRRDYVERPAQVDDVARP